MLQGIRNKEAVTALLLIIFVITALQGCKTKEEGNNISMTSETTSDFIVSTKELAALSKQQGVVIVDARGPEDYRRVHIPGAVNIPKDMFRDTDNLKDILDYKRDRGFAVPPETAERIFSEAGIDTNTRVIVYDSTSFPHASIIWAILKYFGHDNVQVLKGGLEKWASEGSSVTTELPVIQKKTFIAAPSVSLLR